MKGGRSGGYCSSLKSSGWSEDSGANAVDRWDHGPFCSMSIVLKAGETKSLPRKSGSWTGTIGISNAPAAAQGSEAESKDTETAPVQKRCSMSDLAAWRPNDFSGFGGMSRLRNGASIWTDRNYKFSGVGSNRDSSADSTDKTYFVRGKHERYEGNGRGPASIKAPDCGSVTIHLWAMKGGRSGGYCSSLKSSGWSEDSGSNAVDRRDQVSAQEEWLLDRHHWHLRCVVVLTDLCELCHGAIQYGNDAQACAVYHQDESSFSL